MNITIGDRIRTLREVYKYNRPQMAAILDGMPPSTIKNYEMGYRQPSVSIIQSIAEHFGNSWALYVLGTQPQPKSLTHPKEHAGNDSQASRLGVAA